MIGRLWTAMLLAVVTVPAAIGGETVLLDFRADWCAPCRMMDPVVKQLAEGGYPVRAVNVDQEPALANQFRVKPIPCFVLLVDGREVERLEGPTDLPRLRTMFRKAGVNPTSAVKSRAQSPDGPAGPVAFPEPTKSPPLVALTRGPIETSHNPADSVQPRQNDQVGTAISANDSPMIQASVRLRIDDGNGNSVGSGTIIDARAGEALIVTCGHVFRDSQGRGQVLVDLFGPHAPKQVPGRVISYNLETDIGLVSICTDFPVTTARIAPLGFALKPNDQVVNVGCNHGDDPTARNSHVTTIDRYKAPPNVQVAGQPVEGRSGGGLFTPNGLVVGVCNAADPADNEGLYAAISNVHQELDRLGLSFVYGESLRDDINPAALVSNEPPPMPTTMPAPRADRPVLQQTAHNEQSGAEVICIVRSRLDATKTEVIKLDNASPAFLERLAAESGK